MQKSPGGPLTSQVPSILAVMGLPLWCLPRRAWSEQPPDPGWGSGSWRVSGLLSPARAGSAGTTEAQVQLQRLWLLLRLWRAGRASTQQKQTLLIPLLQRSGTFCPNSQASQGWKKLFHFSLQQLVPLFCIFPCPLRVPQLYFQHCVLFLFLV